MSEIFICYRREDSSSDAGRLYDKLTAHFGHGRIFMDIDHIRPGEDFNEIIQRKLSSVKVAIILIGKHWIDITDGEGRRRLDNPDDFVSLEIETILEQPITAIPVLVGGAVMPKASQLPHKLIPLVQRHAFEVSYIRYHSDVDLLIKALEKVIPVKTLSKLDVIIVTILDGILYILYFLSGLSFLLVIIIILYVIFGQ